MKSNKNIVIILLVVALAFLLGMQINSNGNTSKEPPVEEEKGEEQEFDITDVGATDGGDAGVLEASIGKYTIRKADDIYSFDGVSFTFTSLNSIMGAPTIEGQAPQIQVRMHFDNFQRNSRPIDLASFSLGLYQGQCSEVEDIESKSEIGEKIAFAQCISQGQNTSIIVAQKGKIVSAHSQTMNREGSVLVSLHEILSIDISQIVE